MKTFEELDYEYLEPLSNHELLSLREHLQNYIHMINLSRCYPNYGMGEYQAKEKIKIIDNIFATRSQKHLEEMQAMANKVGEIMNRKNEK